MTDVATTLTVASARVEAARQVKALPAAHRSHRLHGHSFLISVFAQLPAGWASFEGAEVGELTAALEACVAPLNYALLNESMEQPTDENIARWVRQRLQVPGIDRIAVQSTEHQGVDLDAAGHAHVWRRYRFQAAHQLPNVPVGHKCGRLHGHGFEVIVHANQDIGDRDLSIDYDHLDSLWAPFHYELNYKCLNHIEGLSNPTSEVISAWLWRRLKEQLPELSWVTVFETGSCGANFDGSQYRIWKEFTLDSAVRLQQAPATAPQGAVHGHTFTLRLHLSAPIDEVMGWTVDFGDVKKLFDPIFKSLDHHPIHLLEDGPEDGHTSAIAAWIRDRAVADLPPLVRVDLYESEGCGSVVSTDRYTPALPV
jgi:6-pyruvoyltetrahydropterin/6-carboxytetrahydropterin synthase